MLYEREEPINTRELRRLIIANLPDDYLAAKPTGAKDPHPFQLWSVEAIRGLVLNVSAASLHLHVRCLDSAPQNRNFVVV